MEKVTDPHSESSINELDQILCDVIRPIIHVQLNESIQTHKNFQNAENILGSISKITGDIKALKEHVKKIEDINDTQERLTDRVINIENQIQTSAESIEWNDADRGISPSSEQNFFSDFLLSFKSRLLKPMCQEIKDDNQAFLIEMREKNAYTDKKYSEIVQRLTTIEVENKKISEDLEKKLSLTFQASLADNTRQIKKRQWITWILLCFSLLGNIGFYYLLVHK